MVDGIVSLAVTLEGDGAVGPSLFKVTIGGPEVIMDRAFLPDSVLLAALEEQLDVQVGEDFKEEHATEQGKQKLLVHDDGRYGYHAANGEAARVAHEDLGRVGVEPQETDEGTHKSGHEHDKLLAAGDIH